MALGLITDAMEPTQAQSVIPAEEQLLGARRGMTAGGVRDRMLEQLSDVRLHPAITNVLVAFGKQTEAVASALGAGHEAGRAIRSRARTKMAAALGAVQQGRLVWLPSAARLLLACMEAAKLSETVDNSSSSSSSESSSGGGLQASAGRTGMAPQAQRLLGALEDSSLLAVVCGETLLLPGNCTPSAAQTGMLCKAVGDLGMTLRALAKLARHRLQRLQGGGPSGPVGTPGGSAGSQGGQQPLPVPGVFSQTLVEGAAQAVRLLLPPHVQQLQLCLLRRWVAQHAAQREQGLPGAGDGGASPPAEERPAQSCGWPFLDTTDIGHGSDGLLDDRALPEPALRTWQAVWEVWGAVGEEEMAKHGLAAELGEAEHGAGGGGMGGGRRLMPALLLTPQDLRAELLHFLQAAECAVGLLDEGGGGGGGGGAYGALLRMRLVQLDLGLYVNLAVGILDDVHTWQAARFPLQQPADPEERQQQVQVQERQQQAHLAAVLGGLGAVGRALSVLTVLASKYGWGLGPPQTHGQEDGRGVPTAGSDGGQASVGPGPGQCSDEAHGLLAGAADQLHAQMQDTRQLVENYVIRAVSVAARLCMCCSGFTDPAVGDDDLAQGAAALGPWPHSGALKRGCGCQCGCGSTSSMSQSGCKEKRCMPAAWMGVCGSVHLQRSAIWGLSTRRSCGEVHEWMEDRCVASPLFWYDMRRCGLMNGSPNGAAGCTKAEPLHAQAAASRSVP